MQEYRNEGIQEYKTNPNSIILQFTFSNLKLKNEPNCSVFQLKNGLCQKLYTCIPAFLHTCFCKTNPIFRFAESFIAPQYLSSPLAIPHFCPFPFTFCLFSKRTHLKNNEMVHFFVA